MLITCISEYTCLAIIQVHLRFESKSYTKLDNKERKQINHNIFVCAAHENCGCSLRGSCSIFCFVIKITLG